ncbi:Uncharacterised protein [uncultured archaeon]|nr:Uncharacterised protein [uncultured archaeon]
MTTKDKLKSRKFQVWIVWMILTIVSLFINDLPKETIFTYFGIISIIYIGSNAAQNIFMNGRNVNTGGKP